MQGCEKKAQPMIYYVAEPPLPELTWSKTLKLSESPTTACQSGMDHCSTFCWYAVSQVFLIF